MTSSVEGVKKGLSTISESNLISQMFRYKEFI